MCVSVSARMCVSVKKKEENGFECVCVCVCDVRKDEQA